MGTVSTLLTFDQFEQLPDKPGKLELLRGELIELPPPEQDHDDIAQLIFIPLFDTLRKLRDERLECRWAGRTRKPDTRSLPIHGYNPM